MPINPKIEAPLRDMLGHSIRTELDDVARIMTKTGDKAYAEALTLCIQATAYITIDVGKRWPTDAGLRECAKIAARSRTDLPVTEDEMYQYLKRSVFGFEPLKAVFPDDEKLGSVPLFTTANLLVSFTPKGQHWDDYLDTIWNSIEAAEKAGFAILPALMYRHRAAGAHTGKSIRPSTS